MSETCPRCGAAAVRCQNDGAVHFFCRSTVYPGEGDKYLQRVGCMEAVMAQQAAELTRLRAELEQVKAEAERLREAFILSHYGDLTIKWNPDGFWCYGRDLDQSLVRLA